MSAPEVDAKNKLTYSDHEVTLSDPTLYTPPLTSTYITWPIISLFLGIKRLAVVVEGDTTKFNVKHQGKDNHHPPSISINDLLVTFLGRPFALPFP